MHAAQSTGTRRREPGTPGDRFATTLRWLRWPVVIAWLLAIVALNGLSGSLSSVTDDTAAAYLPSSAPSTKVALLEAAKQGQLTTNAAVVVFARDSGLTAADRAAASAARHAVAGLSSHIAGLSAPGEALPSADGSAVQFTVGITAKDGSSDRQTVQAIRKAVDAAASPAPAGLAAAVTGPAAVNADSSAGSQQKILLLTALVIVAVILLLGAACAGLLGLRIDSNPVDNVKGRPGSVTGAQLLAEHYPAGLIAPLTMLAPPSQAAAAAATAQTTPGVGTVVPAAPVQGYDSYSIVLSVPPYGSGGTSATAALRQRLSRHVPGALVGGQPAIEYDAAQAAGRDDAVIIPLVLAVILFVITLLLRAVVAPLVLVGTTALSFAASFGLSVLLWRYGLGYPGVQPVIPAYIFIFLVALGVDYNIFLSARIREESRRLGTRTGTLRGLTVTGGVITAAGIVLAGTFAALTQIPQVNITEVGTAVALGVLLDTLIVRTVLVPASLFTIADRAWWPSRLR